MIAKTLHITLSLLRHVLWTAVLLTALYFAVLMAVDTIPGVDVDPYQFFVGRMLMQNANVWVENVATQIWGDQAVLRWRADQTTAQLEEEIEQLQWLEAQSTSLAAALETKLVGLEGNLESSRTGLTQLAAIMEQNPDVLVAGGVTLRGAQIETYATQKMMEFSVLQEQLALYQASHRAYLDAALQARSLWMEARQNIKVLDAHLALIDATLTLERTRTPGAEGSQNIRRLSERLQEELQRNQRIGEERQRLENSLHLDATATGELGDVFDRSSDLVRAMRNLSAPQPN
jgi:hypothetical protein